MSRNAIAEIDEIVRDRESPPKINGAHREVKEVSWPDWGVTHVNAEKRGANVGHPAIGVGVAKFAWDLGTVGYGYFFECK